MSKELEEAKQKLKELLQESNKKDKCDICIRNINKRTVQRKLF